MIAGCTKTAKWMLILVCIAAVMACSALMLTVTGLSGFTVGAVPIAAVLVGACFCLLHGVLLR